jgi:hypothetical protein
MYEKTSHLQALNFKIEFSNSNLKALIKWVSVLFYTSKCGLNDTQFE